MQGTGDLLERKKFITKDEYSRLLKVSKEEPRAYITFFVCGNVGLRIGEFHRILVGDVSRTEDVLTIRTEKQKEYSSVKFQIKNVEGLRAISWPGLKSSVDHTVKCRIDFDGGLTTEVRWMKLADVAKAKKLSEDKTTKRSDPVVRLRVPKAGGGPRHAREVHHDVICALRKWIKDRKLAGDDVLFPWSKRQSQYYWQTYSKKAGLEVKAKDVGEGRKGRGIHCLRHLRGLMLADAGGSLQQIRQGLRQKSESSAAVYAHTVKFGELVKKVGVVR
jgi:integrase